MRFFRTVRIGFGKLKQLLAAASSTTPDAITHSPVMQLLHLLSQADLERSAFTERYLQLVEGNDEVVRTCLDQWDTARWGPARLADRISNLLDWVLGMVRSSEARTLLKAFVEDYGSAITEGAGALVFAGHLVEERLLQRDAAMTAQEYLCVATVCGVMRVLGTTGLQDGRRDVTPSA